MKKLIILTLIASFTLIACEGDMPKTGKSTKAEMEATEKNHQRLRKAVPEPQLNDSLERHNLSKYLKYWNKPNRISYIYLISRAGAVVGHYAIVGKITYCRSKLTTRDQLVTVHRGSGYEVAKLESPGLDGSYGPSEDAIFFFTQENPEVPVVWKGDYFVSGVPMQLSTRPILVRQVK